MRSACARQMLHYCLFNVDGASQEHHIDSISGGIDVIDLMCRSPASLGSLLHQQIWLLCKMRIACERYLCNMAMWHVQMLSE